MNTKLNNLLVVEDHSFIEEKITEEARKIETINNIHVSKSLKEAFNILQNNDIEVITLDLSLPDGNGLDILVHLYENKLEKKVLVFSSSTELKQTCLRYGADNFFDKDGGFQGLVEKLKSV